LSIGIKLMGVPGPKLLEDEQFTQDFTGISAPTFTTPDVKENARLPPALARHRPLSGVCARVPNQMFHPHSAHTPPHRSYRASTWTTRKTGGAGPGSDWRAGDVRRCSATDCKKGVARTQSAPANRISASGCARWPPRRGATATPATTPHCFQSASDEDRSATASECPARHRPDRARRPWLCAGSHQAAAAAGVGLGFSCLTLATPNIASPALLPADKARN